MNITVSLFGQMAAFILLIWFVNKVLWTPLTNIMHERQKRIEDGLAAGDKGKKDLELSEKRATDLLQEVKLKSADLLVQAEKRASEIVDLAKHTAQAESDKIKVAAQAELAQEVNRAKEKLRGQVASIAAAGAAKILNREIDESVHKDLMKDLAAQI